MQKFSDEFLEPPFSMENPTPLNSSGKEAVERARESKDSKNLDLSLQSLRLCPIQIFSLDGVTHLNLSVNYLRLIPETLCSIPSLMHLDLSSNQIDAVPSAIGRLTALTSLNLRHNAITELPAEFNELKKLAKVNFEYNHLREMPNLIGMGAMDEMKIKNNKIRILSKVVFSGENGTFDYQSNKITELEDLSGFQHAVELQFSENRIEQLRSFAGLPKVAKFYICSNQLSYLPADIYNLRAITDLDLRENSLQSLPDEIGLLQTLRKLTVCANRLVGIPAHIWQLKELQMLNLSANLISDAGIPAGIEALGALKELYLGGNMLTGVPGGVFVLPSLGTLNLSWNHLHEFAPPAGALGKLTHLFLTGNRLEALGETLCGCKCLKELHVAGNALFELPAGMEALKGLEQIDARANRLQRLPVSLRLLSFLERLDASDNGLLEVPDELREKKMLKIILEAEGSAAGGERGRFAAQFADMKGRRWNMEDAITIQHRFRGREDEAYWGVFDGHGGDKASAIACVRHPELLAARLGADPAPEEVVRALCDSFVATSKEMTVDNIRRSGSTAVVAYVRGHTLFIADVGDSRAVLYAGKKAMRVSLDHKPDLPEEEERIRRLGGFVSPNGRVVGMLAVARAFGDIELQPYVTAEPYVRVVDLREPRADFLVLACDGVWDVVSDERACEIVASEADIFRGAMKLRDHAHYCGSTDNISVVVVDFSSLEP